EAADALLRALDGLAVGAVRLDAEAPQEEGSGGALDGAVEPEADEGDAFRGEAGGHGDDGLDDVVREGRGDEPARDAAPVPALGDGAHVAASAAPRGAPSPSAAVTG